MPTFTALLHYSNSVSLRDGIAGVYNGSNASVEVKEIRLLAPGRNALATIGPVAMALQRISAVVTSGITETKECVEHDTSSEAPPSQIKFYKYPSSVTVSSTIRNIVLAPQRSVAAATTLATAAYGGYGGSPSIDFNNSSLYSTKKAGVATGVIQGIVLREGEGLALSGVQAGMPHIFWGGLIVTSWNSSDAKMGTYSYAFDGIGTPFQPDEPVMSLFNGSGSGRNLVVHAAFRIEPGEGTATAQVPPYRLVSIDGYVPGENYHVETWMGHDSGNMVPAGLVAVEGDFRAKLAGENSGVPYDWFSGQQAAIMSVAAQHRIGVLRRQVIAPFSGAVSGDSPMLMNGGLLYKSSRPGEGIMLRPGSGVALVAGDAGVINYSAFRYMDVSITVEVTYPQIPSNIMQVV